MSACPDVAALRVVNLAPESVAIMGSRNTSWRGRTTLLSSTTDSASTSRAPFWVRGGDDSVQRVFIDRLWYTKSSVA